MRRNLMILTALIFILTGCLPGQTPVDVQSQVNTAVAQAMETSQRQVEESVALTVAAQQFQFTPTAEEPLPTEEVTLEPTGTPFDLLTPTPFLPTSTPRPDKTPKQPAAYACSVANRRPYDNTEFNRGAKFEIKWTIVNTGTHTWPKGIDVKYYSGSKMTSVKRVEIPKEMTPGKSYTVVLDAVAPDKKGFHVMTWLVDGPMCRPYTAIYVK